MVDKAKENLVGLQELDLVLFLFLLYVVVFMFSLQSKFFLFFELLTHFKLGLGRPPARLKKKTKFSIGPHD